MNRHFVAFAALALAAVSLQASEPGPAAYARLKTLAGEWEAKTEMGKVRVSYELIAGGTSLVERIQGESMPAMMTVYYLDGDRLMLTHYCMAGNQPRMQARAFNPETGELDFAFLDATNLPAGAGHMHSATFHVADNNHLSEDWQFWEGNQLKRTETFQYTRVK